METMTQRTAFATPASPAACATTRALVLAGATADLRTTDVRTVARAALLKGTGVSIAATQRVRATGSNSGMRHTGFPAYVPGSIAWSPPI